ncbi:Uncharacterized protein HZ326_16642 [Fusarium oxysporum f. sp. albedinis]|nr:Uncharacterized protein HZ326_16642 [Fusarium oxysporum f. sp. albedinis]
MLAKEYLYRLLCELYRSLIIGPLTLYCLFEVSQLDWAETWELKSNRKAKSNFSRQGPNPVSKCKVKPKVGLIPAIEPSDAVS